MVNMLEDAGLDQGLIKKHTVKVVRIKSLIDKYNIKKINFLKIDTEGHDCIILNDFFDTIDLLPRFIQFESNVLSDEKEVKLLTDRIAKKGYSMQYTKGDIICRL